MSHAGQRHWLICLVANPLGLFLYDSPASIFTGEDKIARLKLRARRDRDAAIQRACDDYHQAMAEIRLVSQSLTELARRRRLSTKRHRQPPAAECAETILSDCGPMTVQELAVEILARGLRDDEPAVLMKNLRASMRYHARRFWQDVEQSRIN